MTDDDKKWVWIIIGINLLGWAISALVIINIIKDAGK